MDENNKKTDLEKVNYSFDMLLNDIVAVPTEDKGKPESDDKNLREYQPKLIVVQMLLDLAKSCKTENYKDNVKLRNAIKVKVDGDEQLSGYMFFVSQNPQFDYSWNYMRKCKTNYMEFLINSIRFFNNVLVDINMLIEKPRPERNIHVVFHDILEVELTNKEPFVKTRLLWDNFYRLATVKSDYNIIVKAKDTLLKATSRKGPSDIENLMDSFFEMETTNQRKIQKNETV